MGFRICLLLLLFCILFAPLTLSAQESENQWWSDQFHLPGLDGQVNCMVEFEGDLILGGAFTHAEKLAVGRIVRWDGTAFSPIGGGFEKDVSELTVHRGVLYAKVFTSEPYTLAEYSVYRWERGAWEPIVTVPEGGIRTLATCGDSLFIGGMIDSVEGVAVTNIAVFDGRAWSAIGAELDTMVTQVTYHDGSPLAVVSKATEYTNLFNESSIWRFDGTSWVPFGPTFSGRATVAMTTHLGELYAVTWDPNATAPEIQYLLHRWSGSNWVTLDEQQSMCYLTSVRDLFSYNGKLFAAGWFFMRDDTSFTAVVEWDGTSYRKTGAEFGNTATVLATFNGDLIAGGEFVWAGDFGVNYISRYDGSTWHPLSDQFEGLGIQGTVNSVCAHDSLLVAGGYMFTAGQAAVRGIALFDGTKWSAMAGGCPSGLIGSSGTVADIVYFDGSFVACAAEGFFVDQSGNRFTIARWTGSDWERLGTNPPTASALAVYNNELYSVRLNRVYRYEAGNWTVQSPVLTGNIFDLVVHEGSLYAVGNLAWNFGDVVKLLLRFDGTTWSTIDIPGSPLQVYALGSLDHHLYLGGRWAGRGGIGGVRTMMRWDGNIWSAVPEFEGAVGFQMQKMGRYGKHLITFGSFTVTDGPDSCKFIAGFDGQAWHQMGSGFDLPNGATMTEYLGRLIAGGQMSMAGGKQSRGIAFWQPDHDADALFDGVDNCPYRYNPDQADITGDGIGDACCCVGTTGDFNQSQTLDLTDLSILITILTGSYNETLPCPYETYADGYAGITLSDLSQLVGYFTQSPKPQLPNCP